MPGKAKRARPGKTSTIPVKKRAPPARPAYDVWREADEARRAWTDPRDVVVARAGDAGSFSKASRDVDDVDDVFADAEPSDAGQGVASRGLVSSIVTPLRRIARECLLRGDLPRAAAAAALLLSAARAPAAGARAAAAAAAAKRRDKGHPDSRRRGEYAAAEREALAIAAECARLPQAPSEGAALGPDAPRLTPPSTLSRGRLSATPFASPRPGSRAAASSALAAVAACFAPADEVRARELARESALGGSLDDQTDLLELVASHLTGPTPATRDPERAAAESRRRTRAQFRSATAREKGDGVSFARRRAEALAAFARCPRGAEARREPPSNEDPSFRVRAFVRAFVRDARRNGKNVASRSPKKETKKETSDARALNEASRLLEKVFAEAPWDFTTAAALVFASLRAGNVEEAVRVAAAAAAAAPLDADAAALFAELGIALRRSPPYDSSSESSESSSESSSDGESDSDGDSDTDSDADSDADSDDSGRATAKFVSLKEKEKDGSALAFPSESVPSAAAVAAACLAAARRDPGSARAAASLVAAVEDLEGAPTAEDDPAPPTPRDVLECFAARVEAAPRAPGAWWALTRALVGFEAGETNPEPETDPAVRALAVRGAPRRLRPVAPPAAARDVFLNHAPHGAPVDRYALPRHRWWPKCLLARDLLDGSPPEFPAGDELCVTLRLLEAQAACAEVLFPEDGFHLLANAFVRESARERESLNATHTEDENRTDTSKQTHSRKAQAPAWTAAGRAGKRSAGVGRGGAFARWTRRGKKALGKSFYDAGVRGFPVHDAYHRSRLAKFANSVLAGSSGVRAGSDDRGPATDADEDARSLSSLASGEEDVLETMRDGDVWRVSGQTTAGDTTAARGSGSGVSGSGVSSALARRTRKDALRAKRGTRLRVTKDVQTMSPLGREAASREAEKERHYYFSAETETRAETVTASEKETPRWTESGARFLTASERALASRGGSELDLRCKACFYAKVSRKRCGSAKAPTFCFLV